MNTVGPGRGGGDVLSALRSGRIRDPAERLQAATKLLEGSFYEELFKVMRQTVPEGGALSGGQGEEIFQGMMDQRVAEAAAMGAERGLGDALYRHFVDVGLVPGESTSESGPHGGPVHPGSIPEADPDR